MKKPKPGEIRVSQWIELNGFSGAETNATKISPAGDFLVHLFIGEKIITPKSLS